MTKPLNEEQSHQLWKKIFSEPESLPTLPHIINQVLDQIDSPQSDAKDFQNIISQDPILTAKVLKMSNSAYYGFSREIVTLSEAVIVLGLETLKSLVIAASAYKSLNKEFKSYTLNKGDLWNHSLATAISARYLAKELNYQATEKFFITGLLHDIGKILLSKYLDKYITTIKTLVKMREITFDLAEKEVLQFNHCEVGAELSKFWKLPEIFYNVIKYHHTPYAQDTRFNDYIKVIHVADIVAYKSRVSGGIDRDSYCLNNDVIHDLHMEKELINKMVENVRPSLKEFDRVLIN